MNDVTILGLGLMGGSLGLALKSRQPHVTVHGFTRDKARSEVALKRRAVDVVYDSAVDAVSNADIVVLCAPILSIPAQLDSVINHLKPGAIVTDVGSTKAFIQRECRARLDKRQALFIGSHPIAGSEQQGIDAARPDLYDNAMVVITPDTNDPADKVLEVETLWSVVGGRVCLMTPEEHDQVLATTSHLPHLIASLLAFTVGRPGLRSDLGAFCGTGYRDTTRVAAGGIDIWMDIVKSNKLSIVQELSEYRENLTNFIEKLEQDEFSVIEQILNGGKTSRKAFTEYGNQNNSEE